MNYIFLSSARQSADSELLAWTQRHGRTRRTCTGRCARVNVRQRHPGNGDEKTAGEGETGARRPEGGKGGDMTGAVGFVAMGYKNLTHRSGLDEIRTHDLLFTRQAL